MYAFGYYYLDDFYDTSLYLSNTYILGWLIGKDEVLNHTHHNNMAHVKTVGK